MVNDRLNAIIGRHFFRTIQFGGVSFHIFHVLPGENCRVIPLGGRVKSTSRRNPAGPRFMEWITTSTVLHDLRDFENRAAWERFAARFRRPIISFALKIGLSDTDAEDVAQETLLAFAQAYRNGQYDRTKGRLSHWLFGIAYRQALQERRAGGKRDKGAVQQGGETHFWTGIPEETAASGLWDVEWEQALLQQCLEQVRREVEPATFQAFELVVCQERSADDAAKTLGVPIKLVYNAKHRILKRVRELRAEYEELA